MSILSYHMYGVYAWANDDVQWLFFSSSVLYACVLCVGIAVAPFSSWLNSHRSMHRTHWKREKVFRTRIPEAKKSLMLTSTKQVNQKE